MGSEDGDTAHEAIRIHVERDLWLIPAATTATGLVLGGVRGSRQASLQYLAENAHRAPRTVEEWYFYHKTKNYRVIMGTLKRSGRDGVRFGAAGALWVAVEQGVSSIGLGDWRELCAALGLAGTVSAVYRLPRRSALQTMLLGSLGGTLMVLLGRSKDLLSQPIAEN